MPVSFSRLGRFEWGVVLLHILAGITCCFVPVLQAVEYPLSLLLSLFSSVVFAVAGAVSEPGRGLASGMGRLAVLVVASVLAAVMPVAVASGMSGAVCEPAYGLLFILLGPICSGWMGATIGLVARLLIRRPLWASVAAVVAVAASLLVPLAEFYWTPAVRFYGTFFGLYHGAVYDEAVFVELPYLWLRLWNLCGAAALLLLLTGRNWRRWVGAALAVCWVVLLISAGHLGFVSGRAPLEKALTETTTTPGFIIHSSARERTVALVPHLAEDLAFRADQIAEAFSLPERSDPIHVYLYDSAAQKGKLMGAGRTSIAKPWLGELHIHTHQVGDSLIAHELTHVMLATHADSLLGVPATWAVIPRPGIIEGAAVAVERGGHLLTVHQWTRAMRDVEKMPDMEAILEGLGFWRQSGSLAYTACGSFVRFLLDTYGPGSFVKLYGGATFQEAYGQPTADLLTQWNVYLDSVNVTEGDLELARFVFSRKAVFDRRCPYAGARCLVRGAQKALVGRPEAIYPLGLQAMTMTAQQFSLRSRFARLLLAWGRQSEALNLMTFEGRGEQEELGLTAQAARDLLIADVLWLSGEDEQARTAYEKLATGTSARWLGYGLELRRSLSRRPVPVQFKRLIVGAYVSSQRNGLVKPLLYLHATGDLSALEQLALGLILSARPSGWENSARLLSGALAAGASFPTTVELQARFRLALVLWGLRRNDDGARVLSSLDDASLSPAQREMLADLTARVGR